MICGVGWSITLAFVFILYFFVIDHSCCLFCAPVGSYFWYYTIFSPSTLPPSCATFLHLCSKWCDLLIYPRSLISPPKHNTKAQYHDALYSFFNINSSIVMTSPNIYYRRNTFIWSNSQFLFLATIPAAVLNWCGRLVSSLQKVFK